MAKKIYTFDFEPMHVIRVFWDKKRYAVIIRFNMSELYKPLEAGEKDTYFEQLRAYMLSKRFGLEVHDYEEN